MKKNYLFLFLTVLFFNGVQAQDEPVTAVQKNQFKINMFLPGFVYEHGFDSKNTLYSEASLGLGFSANSYDSNFAFFPQIVEQFRHYTILKKELPKAKEPLLIREIILP